MQNYFEFALSAAGIQEGGRIGFTALVVALLFLLSLTFYIFYPHQ
jgi:xanthine/uracil/vitamin C permease (AzgA family)